MFEAEFPHNSRRTLPGDISVQHQGGAFVIAYLAASGGTWITLESKPSWPTAIRKAHWYALFKSVQLWASRDGRPLQWVDADRLWLRPDRQWWPTTPDNIARQAPRASALYMLRALAPVYIGETENLQERLLHHLEHPLTCHDARGPLMFTFQTADADQRIARAHELITWWQPPCNALA